MENKHKEYKKPLYWSGLLCLIPVVGFFVGVVIAIRGIFKYHNWQYVIIGIIGIIFNASICYLPFYNLKYSKGASIAFSKISQDRLNNIARQVEIYKKLNGNYPDSLLQLRTLNDKTDIVDPLQIRRFKDGNNFFEYQKRGDKYILFSVGIDGIPHTSDDLYPILGGDSSKFGLIRSK